MHHGNITYSLRKIEMTIIAAVQKGPELAIASDSLTSNTKLHKAAEYKVNHHKLLTYGDNIIGLAGHCAVIQVFEDLLAQSEPPNWTVRMDIFHWLLEHQAQLKEDYLIRPDAGKNNIIEPNWLSALLINPHGIFGLDQLRNVTEYSKFWAIGSGESFALGAMEVLYNQDMTATEIAEAAVLAATQFDPGCGAPVYVQTLKKAKKKGKGSRKKRSTKKSTTT